MCLDIIIIFVIVNSKIIMKSLLKQSPIFRKDQLIENLIESFISSLDIKESSKGLYKKTLNQYLNWIENKRYNLADLSRREILEYKKELLLNKSSLTVSSYLNSVRRFYEWAESNKYYPNIAKGIKSPNRILLIHLPQLHEQII